MTCYDACLTYDRAMNAVSRDPKRCGDIMVQAPKLCPEIIASEKCVDATLCYCMYVFVRS